MAKNALMIDPHTGQPVDWTQAQGPSMTFGGIDPKMMALYQQAGLWKPEYGAAVTDWGTDPASRAQARQQWQGSPEYAQLMGSLDGWTQGQARQDYNVADMLQSPDGQTYQQVSQNQGPSFHSDDYRDMATVILGGLGTAYAAGDLAAVGAAGSGGGAAAGGTGYNIGAAANGSLTGGASGAGVGGAASTGYGGLASGAGTLLADAGGGTVSDAGFGGADVAGDPTRAAMYGGEGYGAGMTGGETSAFDAGLGMGGGANTPRSGTGLADFFRGNGSMNDYLRAGQALYGLYSQNKATGAAQDGNNRQLDLMREMYTQNRADNQPLLDMRNSVLPKIQGLIDNPSSITSDPGYQFQLKQGQNQLNNRAAASGNYYSGAQMKAAQQYGQDYAGTKLDQSLNRLMGVATGGQVGANNNQSNNNNFAVSGGNALQQGGNIRAGGYLGQQATVNNGINGWLQDQYDQKYWGRGP